MNGDVRVRAWLDFHIQYVTGRTQVWSFKGKKNMKTAGTLEGFVEETEIINGSYRDNLRSALFWTFGIPSPGDPAIWFLFTTPPTFRSHGRPESGASPLSHRLMTPLMSEFSA